MTVEKAELLGADFGFEEEATAVKGRDERDGGHEGGGGRRGMEGREQRRRSLKDWCEL